MLSSKCTSYTTGPKGEKIEGTKGNITTTPLTFHLKTTTGDKTPAILITPNAETGQFAHFTCSSGLINVTVTGNGIVGEISGYGKANEQTVTFKGTKAISEGGVQTPDEVDETPGTTYDLHASINGTKYTAIEDAEGSIKFAEGNPTLGENIGAGEINPAAGATGAGPRTGGRLRRPVGLLWSQRAFL